MSHGIIALMMCIVSTTAYAQRQSVGLVLSGGGAKGIAHIGVIRALEENGIPIDYITGTSMGAIIGSLYACGYTPDEMEALIKSKAFEYWSSGRMAPDDVFFCELPQSLPSIVSVNLNVDGPSTGVLPTSLINPLPMNFAFMDLYAAHTAQCNADFDNLFVPFRSVCSDVYHKHKIVCRDGSLGDAVRASMSFPVVFTPIEMDSVLVYDGGIYDNFPVDVMHDEFHPDIIIGVDVSAPDKKPDPSDILQQIEDMIMQKSDYEVPPSEGVRIQVPVLDFGLLDWGEADTIRAIGYRTAMSMMDSIKTRVTARVNPAAVKLRRETFNATKPRIRFDSVSVSGLNDMQNNTVKQVFINSGTGGVLDLDNARSAYYRAISPGRLKNLVPQAVWNDSTGMFALKLKATQMNRLKLGFGGYVSSSANSMVFFSAGLNTIGRVSSTVRLDAWFGQSYAAMSLYGRLSFPTAMPTYLDMRGVVLSHKMFDCVPAFFDNETTLLQKSEYYGRVSYGAGVRRDSRLEGSMGVARVSNRSYGDMAVGDGERDRLALTLGQGRVMYESSTFNSNVAPTEGHYSRVSAMGLFGSGRFYPENDRSSAVSEGHKGWLELHARYQAYWPVGNHFSIGMMSTAVVTNVPEFATYGSTMSMLPTFQPTPSSFCRFNPRTTARQYLTVGLTPVIYWGGFHIRPEAHLFIPGQEARATMSAEPGNIIAHYSGGVARHVSGIMHLNMGYSFSFAQLNVYGGYTTGRGRNWDVGLSFGLYFLPPSFFD